MKREERIKVIKAMEILARQVDDCDVFKFWRTMGIDGDDLERYYEDDHKFADLMDTFLITMVLAHGFGGLYCDGVFSEEIKNMGRRSNNG